MQPHNVNCRQPLGLSNSENDAIMIVKTVLFTIVNTIMIVSFVWICSIYQFINTIIKSKEHVFAKMMSMVFTADYTSHDFIKFVPVQLASIP